MRNCSTRSTSVKELNVLLTPLTAELEETASALPSQSSPSVYVTLFSENVLIRSQGAVFCVAVPQICSQGAAMLSSAFSSPRGDQNTVGTRCSEVCRR